MILAPSLQSLYSDLASVSPSPAVAMVDEIWKAKVPKKVQFFGWRLVLLKVNTSDLVQRSNPQWTLLPSYCPFCRSAAEDIQYLFLECPCSSLVWDWIFKNFSLDNHRPNSVAELFSSPAAYNRNPKWTVAFKIARLAAVWCIWGKRNKIIFEDEVCCFGAVMESINFCIALWLHVNCKDFYDFPFSILFRDWVSALV